MFNLIAKLGLDSSHFATGLARAENAAKKASIGMGNAFRGAFVGVFGTAALTATIKSVVDFGGKISDLKQRTFMSTDALQEFDYIASQTGTSLEALVAAEQKLARAQQEAIDGSKEFTAIFQRFGLTVKDLQRLDPHQLFMLLSSAIGNSELTGRGLSDVLQLMGRSAGDLIPAMKEGFEGMAQRAHDLGLVLDKEVIAKLDEIGDRMSEAKMRMRGPAADAAMAGVSLAEVAGASLAGRSAAGAFHEARGPAQWDLTGGWKAYWGAVDAYNQKILDSVGSKSLIPQGGNQVQQRQLDALERIERNTRQEGESIGL